MSAAPLDRFAVVTVSYNSSAQLPEFLRSVRMQSLQPEAIHIADNAAADREAARASASEFGAELVELERNVGYGAAINAAVARLPEAVRFVLIANPDVDFGDDALRVLMESAVHDQTVGSVGPRILNPDGSTYPSARKVPSLRTGIGHALLSGPWPSNPWSREYRGEGTSPTHPRAAGWLSGACLLVRRSAFEQVGGFDPEYFMYFEDVDLGYRLGRAGWVNRYIPSAVVTHIGGLSTRAESRRMLIAHHESAVRFVRRRYASPVLAPVRWALVLGLRLRARHLSQGLD